MKRILVLVCLVLFLGTLVSAEYATAERFVNNKNGTVTDTQAGLMWADKDNGSNIHWADAKIYCEGYGGGGKSGWRMPTYDELRLLNASGAFGPVIGKSGSFIWSSESRSSTYSIAIWYSYILIGSGSQGWEAGGRATGTTIFRALPVRSGK